MRIALLLLAVLSTTAPAAEARPKADPSPAPAKRRWETLPLPPEMPRPSASGHVDAAGGARIYYATFGKPTGPAVILLHGGLGNGDHFAHQVPALVERFRVIAIDSRGQGRSTLGKDKLTYRSMAGDVVAVMDALKIEKASMVGWSDGGAIALALGIHFPARVEKLFVFGTNYDRHGSKRSGPSATFAGYAAKCRADLDRLVPAPKAAYDAAAGALGPVWRAPASFTKEELRSIQAHALIAGADRDEIVVLDQVKEMAALIPNGQLAVLTDASHFAMWQDPAGFNKILVEFLTSR